MPILSNVAIQSLADLTQKLAMKDDCTISRVAPVDDPYASTTGDPIVVAVVKCMVKPLPRPVLLQAYNEKLGAFAKWNVLLPLNTNPLEGDTLTINGQKMIVQIVESPQTWSVNDSVLAAEVV